MKRIILFLLIILLVSTLTSCTIEKKISEENETVSEGYRIRDNQYHTVDYNQEKAYVRYQRVNPDDVNDWSEALWCFSPYEEAKLIVEGKGIDFLISKSNGYIAVEINGDITVYDNDGEIVYTLSNDVINTEEHTQVHLEQWNDDGDTLWCSLMETYVTVAYVSINSETLQPVKYNDFTFSSEEYVLNPNTGMVVYSDYPVTLDTLALEEYMESNQKTTLSVYNLKTKEETYIDSFDTNRFSPRWSSDNEIVYYYYTDYKIKSYHLGDDISLNRENWMRYEDEKFNFSVEYPSEWEYKIEETWEATTEREGSPDGGINLYIDGNKEDQLYILGQYGHWNVPLFADFEKREFTTDSGEKGYLYHRIEDGRYIGYLVLDEGFHGVVINVEQEAYVSNEDNIELVLKSLKLKE